MSTAQEDFPPRRRRSRLRARCPRGRGRYEQIAHGASRFAGNPKVQAAAGKAQDTVAQQAPVVASAVKDKATSAASTVQDKVSDTFGTGPTTTTPQRRRTAPSPRSA